jgi:hypothetical protein
MKPIMSDSAERTHEAWAVLPQKDSLPNDILKAIDGHLTSAISKTRLE